MKNADKYRQELSKYLQNKPEQIHLYWKGRVALYSILKAAGIGSGDEVIIPGYTCVVVPNAIIYTGATPIYVDIDPHSFNTTASEIEKAISAKTKAIICQNTFGLSSDVEKIAEIAKNKNILSIEDCTHGFGGKYNGQFNGTFCDASFFSTQWNKPFSTGIGGFSFIKNEELNLKVIELNNTLSKPSWIQKASLFTQIFIREKFLNERTYWTLLKLYRKLSQKNILLGSSSGTEINSIKMPEKYFMAMSNVQIKAGLKSIKKLPKLMEQREISAKKISDFLETQNLNHLYKNLFQNHSFLKYPLLVKDKEKVMTIAQKEKIPLGDWLNSPLHPIQDNFPAWQLDLNALPKATFAGKHIINIPLLSNNEKVILFLQKIKDEIFSIDELNNYYNE